LVKACADPLEAIDCSVGFEVYDLGLDVAKNLYGIEEEKKWELEAVNYGFLLVTSCMKFI